MASNESQTQEIRQFQLNSITYNSNILVVGRPKSGKSTLIADLLFQISPQKFTNEIYTVGETHNIEYNFNNVRLPADQEKCENKTLRICESSSSKTREYITKVVNRENHLDMSGKSNKRILVIDNSDLHFNDSLKMLMCHHINFDYFIQSIVNTDELNQSNIEKIDYIFVFIGRTKFQREKLLLKLSQLFGEFDEMLNTLLDKNLNNHQCLVIVQSPQNKDNKCISLFQFQSDPFIFEYERRKHSR